VRRRFGGLMGQVVWSSADHPGKLTLAETGGSRPAKLPIVRTNCARESLITRPAVLEESLGPAACRLRPISKRQGFRLRTPATARRGSQPTIRDQRPTCADTERADSRAYSARRRSVGRRRIEWLSLQDYADLLLEQFVVGLVRGIISAGLVPIMYDLLHFGRRQNRDL